MDDIRRPQHQRRDFAMRHRPHQPRPAPSTDPNQDPPQIASTPVQPVYNQPAAQQHHTPAIDYQPGLAPAAAGETDYEHYSQPVPRPRPAAKSKRLPKIRLKYAIAGLVAVLLIGVGAYFVSRPAQKSGFSVAQLSKKSTFGFYYPQPLPNGYAYVTKINAFQDGQAYFMLANGSKHIFFHEQAAAGQNTGGLNAPQTIQTASGKASVGTLAGQPAAKMLFGSTLISVNTTGSVPPADLTQAIKYLKTDR